MGNIVDKYVGDEKIKQMMKGVQRTSFLECNENVGVEVNNGILKNILTSKSWPYTAS